MKTLLLSMLVLLSATKAEAQQEIELKHLWLTPNVHVLFHGYTISFAATDVNKAISFLAEEEESPFKHAAVLDTGKHYYVTLMAVTKMEYQNELQPLIQNGVGTYLISTGHAIVKDKAHRIITKVKMDITYPTEGTNIAYVIYSDPETGEKIFAGRMDMALYHRDLGIDW